MMKTYLVKVDMQDVLATFHTAAEAYQEAEKLSRRFPEFDIGIYRIRQRIVSAEK